MRLKYYKLCLKNIKNTKKKIVFFLGILIFIIITIYIINNNLEPKILALCDSSAKSIALKTTNSVINEKVGNVEYDNLVTIKQDTNGKVTAINANVMELNKIANDVALGIQEKLNDIDESMIRFPIASILGESIFSGYGPKISVKVIPAGNVSVGFNSEFESSGINQTRHKISIKIKTNVKIIAPFFSKTNEYSDEITIAESIIVGEVPTSYYNITGVEELNKDGMLEFFGE